MKRSRAAGARPLLLLAGGACASALALQALAAVADPLAALASRWGAAAALPDLTIRNLSVHRVRYRPADDAQAADDALPSALPSALWTALRPDATTGVVVAWDELLVAADAAADRWLPSSAVDVAYELHVWVPGWGLDALLHAANRKMRTREPFAVLADLPVDVELRFRVRARVVSSYARGWLVTAESAGPWTAPVALAPSTQHALAAAAAFLAHNKVLLALLSGCIGGGALVLAQLYWRQRGVSKRGVAVRSVSRSGSRSMGTSAIDQVDEELRDLRQELADSEAEVRRLMLYRGFGIDALSPEQLDALAAELERTLRDVRRLRTKEEEEEEDAVGQDETPEKEAAGEGEPEQQTESRTGGLAQALAAVFPMLRRETAVTT